MQNWAIALAENFTALVKETSFEEALTAQGVQKRSFGPIPLNYGSVDLFPAISSQAVAELPYAANNEIFWEVAFSTPVESPSRPVVQGSNVLVLWVTEETELDAEAIEDIASDYNSYWPRYVRTAMQQHFLNSPKMDDGNFNDTYQRYFRE